MVTAESRLSREAFWSAVKETRNFDDPVKILNNYNGFHDVRSFQTLFRKCLQFVEKGFALNEDFAVWRKVLVALVDDDGIVFVFANGFDVEFRKDATGKVRMHMFMSREGRQNHGHI